jgi:predicted DNA-binding transcriptional regulator AlpA
LHLLIVSKLSFPIFLKRKGKEMKQEIKNNRFISLEKVSELTSLGKSTVLLWEATNKFPPAVRLSKTKRVWLEGDVDSWIVSMHSQDTFNRYKQGSIEKENSHVTQ